MSKRRLSTTILLIALVAAGIGAGCGRSQRNLVAPAAGADAPATGAPLITVSGPTFSHTQALGGVSLDAARDFTVEHPAGQVFAFGWSARAAAGATIAGYRWSVDAAPLSEWSLAALHGSAGPFDGEGAQGLAHLIVIQARDNTGAVSELRVHLKVIPRIASRPLLLIDDLYGILLRRNPDANPQINFPILYPVEAEQDSFYCAAGGFPDSLRILSGTSGAVSVPGSFAGFDYDTLDYRNFLQAGIALSDLSRYRVVAWYTDQASAAQHDAKFGGTQPATALRFINTVGHVNTLAAYLRLGGKAWLFGEGATTAIANGYYSAIAATGVPKFPYTSGDDPQANVLRPGDFLYDFCHLRSELNIADPAFNSLTAHLALKACLPYLPEFALAPGEEVPADRSKDPRVGPSAAHNALRWSGLPRLTLAAVRTASIDPAVRVEKQTWVITQPLSVLEGRGRRGESALDTLYLAQAIVYDPTDASPAASDGRPNAVDYHGADNGEVVWFGFPLYYFEPDQARTLTRKVLSVLGVQPTLLARPSGPHPFVSVTPTVTPYTP